jgi:hypothetical protein
MKRWMPEFPLPGNKHFGKHFSFSTALIACKLDFNPKAQQIIFMV